MSDSNRTSNQYAFPMPPLHVAMNRAGQLRRYGAAADGEQKKLVVLADEIDRLRAALEHYGHHIHPNCHDLTLKEDGSFGPRNGCLCGFDAALSGESSAVETSEQSSLRAALEEILLKSPADNWWSRDIARKALNAPHSAGMRPEEPAGKDWTIVTCDRHGRVHATWAGCSMCAAEKASVPTCGNPVMINSERYRGCRLLSGHEGECSAQNVIGDV